MGKILDAIQCCRRGSCDDCPIQKESCDALYVVTDVVPAKLLDLIEDELSKKVVCPHCGKRIE